MWVFTTDGFYSVVQHDKDDDLLLVRVRVREDLVKLRERLAPTGISLFILDTPYGDYAHRMAMPRSMWEHYLRDVVNHIDYRNFKDAVGNDQGWRRSSLYHDVWAALLPLQQPDPDQ